MGPTEAEIEGFRNADDALEAALAWRGTAPAGGGAALWGGGEFPSRLGRGVAEEDGGGGLGALISFGWRWSLNRVPDGPNNEIARRAEPAAFGFVEKAARKLRLGQPSVLGQRL